MLNSNTTLKNLSFIRAKTICILFCVIRLNYAAYKEVECEKVENLYFYNELSRSLKTCFMDITTSIYSIGFTISTNDETVLGLKFFDNDNIRYLPENTSQKLPNLVAYHADLCSIQKVFKVNFKGLGKLIYLHLEHNEIEKIDSDTFEGLVSLKWLFLSK